MTKIANFFIALGLLWAIATTLMPLEQAYSYGTVGLVLMTFGVGMLVGNKDHD